MASGVPYLDSTLAAVMPRVGVEPLAVYRGSAAGFEPDVPHATTIDSEFEEDVDAVGRQSGELIRNAQKGAEAGSLAATA